MRPGRWVPVLAVGVLAGVFAWLNRGETAVIHLGVATLYRVPVSLLVLGSFLLGMVAMLLFSLPADLRVRRELRRHRELDRDETQVYGREPLSSEYS